jgi:pteridine reductase
MAMNKTVLITGSARRVGRALALSAAEAGMNVVIHHSDSLDLAEQTASEIRRFGVESWVIQADFRDLHQAQTLIDRVWEFAPLDALVNSAAIFESITALETSLDNWQNHLNVNLTVPFLLSQAFARRLPPPKSGRIVNILDWRALRPSSDHFPYTISKTSLAALTRSLAVSFAPHITVNGIALGAILPPSDGSAADSVLSQVPAGRWAELDEVGQTLLFLLNGPAYITGEIIHVDGGRHLI